MMHVQKALEAVPTVTEATVTMGEAVVEHDGASDEQLLQAVRAAGDYSGMISPLPPPGSYTYQ
jgi:copper chaperone CopZ